MVFVWSRLCGGEPNFTLAQVELNDAIMIVAFAPIVALLLGVASIHVLWGTLMLSVAVLEDLVVYVVLNIALARVAAGSAESSGLLGILGLETGGNVDVGYHIAVTLGFFLLPVVDYFAMTPEGKAMLPGHASPPR